MQPVQKGVYIPSLEIIKRIISEIHSSRDGEVDDLKSTVFLNNAKIDEQEKEIIRLKDALGGRRGKFLIICFHNGYAIETEERSGEILLFPSKKRGRGNDLFRVSTKFAAL